MITSIPNLGMNYVNYKTSIVQKYHVQLVGWPSDIPFANPHQLTTIATAKSLQSALAVSTCKWVVLSKRQQKEHADALEASAEGGQVVGRKRKIRSDKGKRRGKLPDDEDENGNGESNDEQDENDRPSPGKKQKSQKSSASRKKRIPTARKSNVATTSSKNANRLTKKLPPAVLKSKEIIDSDDDDSAN